MIDSLQEMLFFLKRNKLRTLLTGFSVFWGVLTLVVLLASGKGLKNGVFHDFGSDVLDFITINSGKTSVSYGGRKAGYDIELTEDDVMSIKNGVSGVRFVASESKRDVKVKYQDKAVEFLISGVSHEFFNLKQDLKLVSGRNQSPRDEKNAERVAFLGKKVMEGLFDSVVNPLGKIIKVNGVNLTVIGVFDDKANHGMDSKIIYIPSTTYKEIFGTSNEVGTIWIRPLIGFDAFNVEEKSLQILKNNHGIAPEDESAILSFNLNAQVRNINNLFNSINAFLWFVGLGTLAAGIMGISNIMVISVSERKREIGIRRAVGATPLAIISSLLGESVFLTGIAGFLGLLVGSLLIKTVAVTLMLLEVNLPFFHNPEIDYQTILIAILVLILSGAFAGLIPAMHAAQISPIDAMRHNNE